MQVNYKGKAPQYMSDGAAGADLVSSQHYIISPNQQVRINTGTKIEIPLGYVGILVPRSSLCNKMHLSMTNSIGIIDSDFRGAIECCYKNNGDEDVIIEATERICQLVLIPFITAEYTEKEELSETVRGDGSFGSTGEK